MASLESIPTTEQAFINAIITKVKSGEYDIQKSESTLPDKCVQEKYKLNDNLTLEVLTLPANNVKRYFLMVGTKQYFKGKSVRKLHKSIIEKMNPTPKQTRSKVSIAQETIDSLMDLI